MAIEMKQIYETTIMSGETEHAMHVLILPRRSLPSGGDFQVDTLFEDLGLTKLAPTEPASLANHLAILFSPAVSDHEMPQILASAAMAVAQGPKPSAQDLRFAEEACYERVIPFENSPLSAESLAKLATTATGGGLGAYIGFVAFGSGPLLLIAVPAGMIICGAARGVAQALEEGLRERLLQWIKGEKVRAKRIKKER